MPRPPLPIGAWGEIYYSATPSGGVMARAQFRYADGEVRPIKRHRPTKAKAKAALLDALAAASTAATAGEINRHMRLDDLAAEFFQEEERLAAQGVKMMTTVDQYRDHYRRHIAKALGKRTLLECERVSVNHGFLVKLSERSSSTATMCRKVLSAMYGFAIIREGMTRNPMRDVGRFSRKPAKKARALELEQIREWLRGVDNDEYAVEQDLPDISRGLVGTGARISEVLAWSWEDYLPRKKAMRLSHHMVYIKGQGVVRAPATKGDDPDAEPDVLGLPGWLCEVLDRRKVREAERLGLQILQGPIFPHPATGKYRDHREVGKVIRAVRGKLGYEWLTSHSLGRKTVATILDEGGATAREIADQLRHAKPSMTQDVYMARGRKNVRQAGMLESIGDTG